MGRLGEDNNKNKDKDRDRDENNNKDRDRDKIKNKKRTRTKASFHHSRSTMSSKRRVKMFAFCANSTNAEYHSVQRESINLNVMQYMHKSLLAKPKRIATVPLNC